MAGATVNFGPRRRPRVPWLTLAAVVGVGLGVVAVTVGGAALLPTFDGLCGLAVTLVLVGRTARDRPGTPAVLESAPAVWLGVVSYSLYLIHQPLIVIVDTLLSGVAHVGPTARWWALPAVALPTVVAAAYVFHRAVERPFMPGRPRTEAQTARSAALEPAV